MPSLAPPDQAQRERALDPTRSVLVRAPAGSGKTDLLTRRFLRLLGSVDDPSHVVAITFTKAAAAEMRHRIVAELEKAAAREEQPTSPDVFAMETLSARALKRSQKLGWDLLELPAQLRISTIDSFCRELALQQPLLSGLGGGLEVAEQPGELYRRAARETLERLGDRDPSPKIAALQQAIEALLLWRDNNWKDVEDQLLSMLENRDKWMHDFVLDHDPNWDELRARLERPFARAVSAALSHIGDAFAAHPQVCDDVMAMARFACEQKELHRDLAELAEFPDGPFTTSEDLEEARHAYLCLAEMLLTKEGTVRKSVNVSNGFPPDRKREKERMTALLRQLSQVPDFGETLHAVRGLPPARYPESDWEIVRACFTLLRHAAAQLKVTFAESGEVDYIEVAQLAQQLLREPDGTPSDAAMSVADGIHHLLIDEFQDTSRRQHALIASIAAAWPDAEGRTLFVVGDPMQSIYSFRDADAELFPRVQIAGLELPNSEPLPLDYVQLASNFRTAPDLVRTLNQSFEKVFAVNDGSGVQFSSALPARPPTASASAPFHLHLEFVPQPPHGSAASADYFRRKEEYEQLRAAAMNRQLDEIVSVARSHSAAMKQAHARGEKFRIAVLSRTRSSLTPIADALRQASIPFRAIELEPLANRPEVLDALALMRAVLSPEDRVAWLSVLRAPWCGLSLEDLHRLTSADDPQLLRRPVPELLVERIGLLSEAGRIAAQRILRLRAALPELRTALSASKPGTWMEQVWLRLSGNACVGAAAGANLNLLWSRLDTLSANEPALLGSELAATLERLMAQPDPEAESDCGVQLMTIHKSKGLEFEVVIVPDLQARSASKNIRLLSWLERGLPEPGDSGELTEFLVAPVQSKGAEREDAKRWVDGECRARETQEMRRILYVAATRAREELHLFVHPSYKADAGGEFALCAPSASLFATAWPALQQQVEADFETWRSMQPGSQIAALAAQAENNVIQMPRVQTPTLLRRLPDNFEAPTTFAGSNRSDSPLIGLEVAALYRRHEGGLVSRALGSAVHALFERAATLYAAMPAAAVPAALEQFQPRVAALIRSAGLAPSRTAEVAAEAHDIVLRALADPIAAWILAPHPESASETRWTAAIDGALRNVRADRVFRAGDAPHTGGEDTWWIIDYKTTHADGADAADVLTKLHPLFAPQLELYARFLRRLHGEEIRLRAGLYYPRLLQLDWWEL